MTMKKEKKKNMLDMKILMIKMKMIILKMKTKSVVMTRMIVNQKKMKLFKLKRNLELKEKSIKYDIIENTMKLNNHNNNKKIK